MTILYAYLLLVGQTSDDIAYCALVDEYVFLIILYM